VGLQFKERNAVAAMAEVLAEMLPYSGAYEHRGQVTYRSIASGLGIGNYWVKMSKRPGIATMLERILEYRREIFEGFILKSVSEGLKYRQKEQRPITRREIEALNGHILEGRLDLVSMLRSKLRHLADRGDMMLSGRDLL
jgi:hypothetical protein